MVAITAWQASFDAMQRQEHALRRAGLWVSGPSDLLSLGDVSTRELTHSALIGWLLTPTGRHGLGSRFLQDVMRSGWAEELSDPEAAVVQREVVKRERQTEIPRVANATSLMSERRADIVVTAGAVTLVIENWVLAPESDAQCEDLYTLWRGEGDARFLLISPDGRPPREVSSNGARMAWRTLSYPAIAAWLEANLVESVRDDAHESLRQYLLTLRRKFSGRHAFNVRSPDVGFVEQNEGDGANDVQH